MTSTAIERLKAVPVEFDPFSEGELTAAVPSTEAQREIWLAVQMGDAANCAFNESIWMRLRGDLDMSALDRAFVLLFTRHEALRSVLSPDGTSLCVLAAPAARLVHVDVDADDPATRDAVWDNMLRQEVTTPFDLVDGPLFRARIARVQPDEHRLVFTAHHIICDGWSWSVLLEDLVALYAACHQGDDPMLGPAPAFSAYALSQRRARTENATVDSLRYWVDAFSGAVPAFSLPTDRPRPRVKTFNAARHDFRLPGALVTDLKRLGARHGCTLFTTLLTGFAVVLHRISEQSDVLVGITTAGQAASAQPRLVGHCANVLPLRLRIEGREAFAECVSNVNRALLDAYEHADVTLAEILRHVSVPRDASRLPLVSVRFNLGRGGATTARLHGLEWEMFTNPRAFEIFELFIDAMEVEGSLALECYYNTDLFDSDTIHRRLEEFEAVLHGAMATPEQPVAPLQPLSPVIAPPDEVESALIEIHKRLLVLPDVRACDNFFDLGGTSTGAVQLKGDIQRDLGVEVPLPLLFGAPTVAELAVAVRTARQRGIP